MALIKSISGFRGTIGGKPNDNLTAVDVVNFTAAFAQLLKQKNANNKKVVIGRDGRISGLNIKNLANETLVAMGFTVIDLDLSTTPTVEMAVPYHQAAGGIIITASHNPIQWNALKLLNEKGEFISAAEGKNLLALAENAGAEFAEVLALGSIIKDEKALDYHIEEILKYPLVNKLAIANKNFTVVLDAINSSGAEAVPKLLNKLGVKNITVINGEMNGHFAHNPEPLKEHLQELSKTVINNKADIGIAVDPDVDRLCFVNEDGELFGEEYTLVAVADYILGKKPGATVSNLSSTKSLKEITEGKYQQTYKAAAVGEVNVVNAMKELNAVIGGEGNGGIIVPDFHYGRDALIGIALFLSHLAEKEMSMSALRATYPNYFMGKHKVDLKPETQVKEVLAKVLGLNNTLPHDTTDGVKFFIDNNWVHLRGSNTEPIIRIYSEADTEAEANALAEKFTKDILQFA
jgi:phosphomannomutase